MVTKEVIDREKLKREVRRDVDLLFKRIYNIKKIRRKRKMKEWLSRHIN